MGAEASFGSANAATGVRRKKISKNRKPKKSTKRIQRIKELKPMPVEVTIPSLLEVQPEPQSQSVSVEVSSSPLPDTSEAPQTPLQLSMEAVAAMNRIVEEAAPEPEPEPSASPIAPVVEEERLVDAADIATAVQLMGFMAFMQTKVPVANFSNEEAEMVAAPTEKAANHLYQVFAPYLPDYVRRFIRENRKNFALFGEIGIAVKSWKELFAMKEKQMVDYLETHPEEVVRLRAERAA